jgi:uncharacterized protein with NAD-binding domain and iron-sulfur cluster
MTAPSEVPTPASRSRRPTVAVLGAGIAGLTAAHELAERGFEVIVHEPRADERAELNSTSPTGYPPVKLGGLAASQYSTPGPTGGSPAQLRPFPGRRGTPRPPRRAVAGEHGFRFFPAYYLHIWDLLQRIPVYQAEYGQVENEVVWFPTSRTVMDNVRRVVTQAATVAGKPSIVFSREAPRSLAELVTSADQLTDFGFSGSDAVTFLGRLARYLVTSPLRRAAELQNLSAYDFFIGRDETAPRRFAYTPQFESLILDMPKVLAAFDLRWGDARTDITTYLQLMMQMDRPDSKADGVLNGPTTESWFDHWYRHLIELGVRFVRVAVDHLEPPSADRLVPPHLRPRVVVVLTDGTRLATDYVVAAVDAPAAERITGQLRAAGTGGTVAGLDGFATSVPPPLDPLQPSHTRSTIRREPYALDQLGTVPWDRFQTLAGIQYYFDTEFQLVRGHMYHAGTEWGLSSINQRGLWERKPVLARDGYVSVLSVDIGDFNAPSRHLVDEHGQGVAARDCTVDDLAAEVWRQIVDNLTSGLDAPPEALVPLPVWYAIDRNLVMAGNGDGNDRPVWNEAPYLIPIVGDWPNRPSGEPWNPHGTSWIERPTEDRWLDDLERREVWQARHGGYQVHHNSLVFAGTWTKTFTRMTTMEAACESGRHAVNAILDHYIWVESGGVDRREHTTLDWRFPFGFLDQGFSSPVRTPSPAGDYCFVFDIENREPLDARGLRNLDSRCCRAGLPHPLDAPGAALLGGAEPALPSLAGGQPMSSSPNDYTGQLLTYLQAWRQYLEQATAAVVPGQPRPSTPGAMPPVPQMSPEPTVSPPLTAPTLPPLPLGPTPALHAAMPVPWGTHAPGPPASSVPPLAGQGSTRSSRPVTPTSPATQAPGGAARASVAEADAGPRVPSSRFSPEQTTVPSGSVPERRPPSAYPWADAAPGSAVPAAATRSLFSNTAPDTAPPLPPLPAPQFDGRSRISPATAGTEQVPPADTEITGGDPSV